MKKLSLLLTLICAFTLNGRAELASYSIDFGADNSSTVTLDNSNFTTAVKAGKSYIEDVTSVINVFPELDGIKLSSSKKDGGFNIHLATQCQIAARQIKVTACRYDNDNDADAALMINSETVLIPSLTPEEYEIDIVAIPIPDLTNIIVHATKRVYIQRITIVYDTADGIVLPETPKVATPVFTPAGGVISKGTPVRISCATESASIHYTLDGTIPTAESSLYAGPIAADDSFTINAIAVKEGYDDSEMATATFNVVNTLDSTTAFFDFCAPETLSPSMATPVTNRWIDLDGVAFTQSDVEIKFAASGSGNTSVRLYSSYDVGCHLRVYADDSFTVRSLNPNYYIEEITFEIALSGTTPDVDLTASAGEYDWLTNTWHPTDEERVTELEFFANTQSRIAQMTVKLVNPEQSGAEGISSELTEEWYTLQGIRISKPTAPGIYIRNNDKVIIY